MKLSELKIKPPTPNHVYATGYAMTRGHVDYIWGLFKGRELTGGHLSHIERWHVEGEKVAFTDDPRSNGGNVVLVMGIPVVEITGPEADALVAQERAKDAAAIQTFPFPHPVLP